MSKEKTQRYITVMQAYIDGEAIQVTDKGRNSWQNFGEYEPIWDFPHCEYRIRPKSKPSVDWSVLCSDIRYIARDADGKVYGYKHKPVISIGDSQWSVTAGDIALHLGPIVASLTPGECKWHDSLVERPA